MVTKSYSKLLPGLSMGKKREESLFIIHNREQAVQAAVNMAEPGDMLLLVGKGHEKSILGNGPQAQEFRHLVQNDDDPRRVTKRDFDEVSVARAAVRNKLAPKA